jgi:hypothetical protein
MMRFKASRNKPLYDMGISWRRVKSNHLRLRLQHSALPMSYISISIQRQDSSLQMVVYKTTAVPIEPLWNMLGELDSNQRGLAPKASEKNLTSLPPNVNKKASI